MKSIRNSNDPHLMGKVFYDGDSTVISGRTFVTYLVAEKMNTFPIVIADLKDNFNSYVFIRSSPTQSFVTFGSNDLRLYDPFFKLMRKAKVPCTSQEFPMYERNNCTRQYIGISVPELQSFDSLSYVVEKIIDFLKIACHLSKFISTEKCSVNGCRNYSLYYPTICTLHLSHLSKANLDKVMANGKVDPLINLELRRTPFSWILSKLVNGYKTNLTSVVKKSSDGKCFICGETSHISHMGTCTDCYLYMDNYMFEIDYSNRIVTYHDFKNGLWKNYLHISIEEFVNRKENLKKERILNEELVKKKLSNFRRKGKMGEK